MTTRTSGLSRPWVLAVSLVTLLLTLVPYLISASAAQGRHFVWLSYNLDDSCVYLSWMRQAADGSFRALNLFTTDQQNGMLLNPLFLLLGWISRLTTLPPIAVYHLARLGFGLVLLLTVARFIRENVSAPWAQRLAFLLVCFSSGFGWLPFWWSDPPFRTPIDKWQPEAITFLSLYLSPLFVASMALQVAILSYLLQAERANQPNTEESPSTPEHLNTRIPEHPTPNAQRLTPTIKAGLLGLLLSLIHTYDVLSLGAVWLLYLVIQAVRRQPHLGASLLRALITGAITAPGVLYIAWELRQETVFRQRANVETLSPPLAWILLGYGLPLLLACYALYAGIQVFRHSGIQNDSPPHETPSSLQSPEIQNPKSKIQNPPPHCLLPTAYCLLSAWLFANIAIAYLPVPFQRKMLQGAHFPIAILAGVGAYSLLSRSKGFASQPLALPLGAALLVAVTIPTNIGFVVRDINNAANNRVQTLLERPYLLPGEVEALNWIAKNTPLDAAVQPLPWIARANDTQIATSDATLPVLTPGLTHRRVYCGHWGETPDFQGKLMELRRLALPTTSEADRIVLLRKMRVSYLIFSQKSPSDLDADTFLPLFREKVALPSYLSKVYGNPDADIYRVQLP